MASGWNLWVWLPCIGVVSGCCCKEVYYRYFPYSACISSFFGSSIPTSLFIFSMFFRSLYNYSQREALYISFIEYNVLSKMNLKLLDIDIYIIKLRNLVEVSPGTGNNSYNYTRT